jgi:hypothetical protein
MRYLFAIQAGSLSVPRAAPIKEIVNFMPDFSDEVNRKIIGMHIACNDFFPGTPEVPSSRPIGKHFLANRFIAFKFKNPAGSTNGYYER